MKKRILVIACLSLCMAGMYAQMAERVTVASETKAMTYKQAGYFLAAEQELVQDTATDDEAMQALVAAGICPMPRNSASPITYAELAGLCMKIWKLHGGLMYSMTKADRYAFRELQDKGFIGSDVDPSSSVSGFNFFVVLQYCLDTEDGTK